MTTYGFIGAGNMAGAIVRGAIAAGTDPASLLLTSAHDSAARLAAQTGARHEPDAGALAAAADVVVPALGGPLGEQVAAQARELCGPRPAGARHRYVEVGVDGLLEALEAAQRDTGVRMSTMGRGLREDAAAFLAAAAAGRHAAGLLAG